LVVVRSLTKTWGLAGLRIGYVLADPEMIHALRVTQPLWAVGSLALEAAVACSSPEAMAEADQLAEQQLADRAYLLAGLARVAEVDVAATPQAPFVLIRVHGPDPAGVHARMRAQGWAVRRADTFPGLGPGWLRAAIRDKDTSAAFVAALVRAIRIPVPTPPE
jgi:histidinol-phosphate aminotransferase